MFEPRSALEVYCRDTGRDGAGGSRALRISPIFDWHLALLAAFPGSECAFAAAIEPHAGGTLPTSPHLAATTPAGLLFNVAPRQHWFVTGRYAALQAITGAVSPQAGSSTTLSHSRVRVAISGIAARTMLAKLISVDLHPTAFAIGQFAQTGLHHTGVLLHRAGTERYEIYLPRTFAASLWEVLLDASLYFGYDIVAEHGTRSI